MHMTHTYMLLILNKGYNILKCKANKISSKGAHLNFRNIGRRTVGSAYDEGKKNDGRTPFFKVDISLAIPTIVRARNFIIYVHFGFRCQSSR